MPVFPFVLPIKLETPEVHQSEYRPVPDRLVGMIYICFRFMGNRIQWFLKPNDLSLDFFTI